MSPLDPTRPMMSFLGLVTNVPPGSAALLSTPEAREHGVTIRLEAAPTLLEMLAQRETYGRLVFTDLGEESSYLARPILHEGELAIMVCSTAQEEGLRRVMEYDPQRMPRGLRALAAALVDGLAGAHYLSLPEALRTLVSTTAYILAEAIEKTEVAADLPHGAAAFRQEALVLTGHVELLSRALQDPDALPLLDAEGGGLFKSANAMVIGLSTLLQAIDRTLAEAPVIKTGFVEPPRRAAPPVDEESAGAGS